MRTCVTATFWILLGVALGAQSAAAVDIDYVYIGDPGNLADTTTYGAVADGFLMGQFEVVNAEYAEFLNAVAQVEDTFGLWDVSMASGHGGITRSTLGDGTFQYDAIIGRDEWPVNWVTFWDAIRFANWLHNGQPVGMQDATTTEDGAYLIDESGITNNSVTRNPDADVYVPNEDEWYKAAYYDGVSYFVYPAGSNTQTLCIAPGATPNSANCDPPNGPVDVGSYAASPSPYGTFDQGGNVWEWNEDIVGLSRIRRGGSFNSGTHHDLMASSGTATSPGSAGGLVGFRVAPEPGVGVSLAVMVLAIAGLAARRVRRTSA
jgi:sulfatase modifying factor 1